MVMMNIKIKYYKLNYILSFFLILIMHLPAQPIWLTGATMAAIAAVIWSEYVEAK